MPDLIPLSERHIPQVARLHAEALAGDFLPSLGEGFLRAFYRAALGGGLAFGFVQPDDQGQVAGFVLASPDTSRLFRRVLARSAPALGWAALPAILHRPGLLARVAETFLYPSRETDVAERAELLVIAVAAGQRGRGLGAALVSALNGEFLRRGVRSYKVTVLQSNAGANRFYRRLGFRHCGAFELYQKGWNLYTISVGESDR